MFSIEWVAYDLHSGLHSIFWKLYDNYTGEDIIHGYDDIPAQGHTRVSAIKHINMLLFSGNYLIYVLVMFKTIALFIVCKYLFNKIRYSNVSTFAELMYLATCNKYKRR